MPPPGGPGPQSPVAGEAIPAWLRGASHARARRDGEGGVAVAAGTWGSPLPALPVAQQPLGDEGPGGQEEQRARGHGQAPRGHRLAWGRGQRCHRCHQTLPQPSAERNRCHCSVVLVTSLLWRSCITPPSLGPCPHGCHLLPSFPDLPQQCPQAPVGRGTAGPPCSASSIPNSPVEQVPGRGLSQLCPPARQERVLGAGGAGTPIPAQQREGMAWRAFGRDAEGAAGPGPQRE